MKRCIALFAALIWMASTAFGVAASVYTTPKAAAPDAIYIAGNPDLYPIEYYNDDTGCYEGLLPDYYEKLSEACGVDFVYLRAGDHNQQNRMSKNKQVELVSAHYQGEVAGLETELALFPGAYDGKKVNICIGFTDILPPDLKTQIMEEVAAVSADTWLSDVLAISAAPQRHVPIYWFILIGILAAAVIVLVIFVFRMRPKKQEEQEKLIDPLTGIGNEEYLRHGYEHYITEAVRSLYYFAYFVFDRQKFEPYFGADQMKDLQKFAANILSADIADGDFAARIDDGVFVLCYQCPDEARAAQRMEELLQKLNHFDERFVKERQMPFRAGVYHLEKARLPIETVIFNARQAYQDALNSKKPYCFCSRELLSRAETKNRLRSRLSAALEKNEFQLYLQFIVHTQTGVIVGAEAISRWHSPEEGVLSPSHYIADMNAVGIIDKLDFCIFEKACAQLQKWEEDGYGQLLLSCNFTRITISDKSFAERFREITGRYRFDHSRMIIELTEDSFADNKTVAYQNVVSCKADGFQIALDDLGSGYSSFIDLCDYPMDVIKIDRQIVAKSETERGNALMCGLTKLAHSLNIRVLCEGVETEAENERAIATGCEYIQGYYYSRVFPQDAAMRFYEKYNRRRAQKSEK